MTFDKQVLRRMVREGLKDLAEDKRSSARVKKRARDLLQRIENPPPPRQIEADEETAGQILSVLVGKLRKKTT
jgi:hypothetical protein